MADEATAQKAIDQLNGREVDGRPIKVAEARPKRQRRDNSYGGGGYGRY
jgi:hypothetical protein